VKSTRRSSDQSRTCSSIEVVGRIGNLGLAVTTRFVPMPPVGSLPVGRMVDLPGRGSTFVTDTGPAEHGRSAAAPVLLLHALACTGLLTWYPSVPALRERYRTITFDQRWHGRGIRSPHFDLDDLADDVIAVADSLDVARFVVAGYSMGSLVAQLVARRYPDRVAGLVLGASTMRFRRGAADPVALRVLSTRLRLMAERRLRGGPFGAPLADVSNAGRWAIAQFRSTSAAEIAGATAVIARFDSTSWLHEIAAPAAVIVTRRDRAVPRAHQYELARRLGAVAFEIDAGHAAVVLDAERFRPALLAACASAQLRCDAHVRP
jgi:3-oxoadipate enol-lactonase